MFNFNKGQSIEVKQSSSIFNLDEIRDIVLEFPPSKHYTKSESDGRREITWPKFFRLTDGTQHVSWESLISKVQDLLSTGCYCVHKGGLDGMLTKIQSKDG